MLTTAPPKLAATDFDPLAVVRAARDVTLPDAAELVRQADIGRRVDAGLDAATEAVRGALERLPGRQRRRRRPPLMMAGMLVGILAAVGVAAWWARRTAVATRALAREEDVEIDAAARDRAADEGMPARPATMDAAPAMDAVPAMDAAPAAGNGTIHELVAVEELVAVDPLP